MIDAMRAAASALYGERIEIESGVCCHVERDTVGRALFFEIDHGDGSAVAATVTTCPNPREGGEAVLVLCRLLSVPVTTHEERRRLALAHAAAGVWAGAFVVLGSDLEVSYDG